jgi:hypothetical protein
MGRRKVLGRKPAFDQMSVPKWGCLNVLYLFYLLKVCRELLPQGRRQHFTPEDVESHARQAGPPSVKL